MGLQFSWIKANVLGFFLVDVRNLRGKFDEIKEEFAINPGPIASQLSLKTRGDHDELEIFLKICLIPFTNRSKVEEQRENTWVFKGEISPKSWAIEAVVGQLNTSLFKENFGPKFLAV